MHIMVQANAYIYVPASCLNMVRTYSSMYTSFQYYECCMLIYIIIIVVMVIPCLRALFYAIECKSVCGDVGSGREVCKWSKNLKCKARNAALYFYCLPLVYYSIVLVS